MSKFLIEDGILKRYSGADSQVVIPDGVTEICSGVFRNCQRMISVTIPDSVVRIGKEAFESCECLRSVVIPDSVKEIGTDAFKFCESLTSVILSGSLRELAEGTFCFCSGLLSVILPDGITKIGTRAFRECEALTSVTIPDGVTEIGRYAFDGCTALVSADLPGSVTRIGTAAFRGCRGLADKRGFTIKGGILFLYCGKESVVSIPDGVTDIGPNAFSRCKAVTSVTIPEGVTEIESEAFDSCTGLTSVALPGSLKVIWNSAFNDCRGLASIALPDSVTDIRDYAFANCTALTSIVIPEGAVSIGAGAFLNCTSLTSVVLPGSLEQIGFQIFENCLKVTVICPENSYAHHYCEEGHDAFLFDYQAEAFHGVIPPGLERLSAPFLADEDKPYIFISYSHRDRDKVLEIIRTLYEAGWRIWYDEGLTIGDRYDETLEAHVKNCAAVLLFVTQNSMNSFYILENELPWAIGYGKPVIRCILEQGTDIEVPENMLAATIPPGQIQPALEKISGLEKGESRIAKGITVVYDPAVREGPEGSGFAYCLYAPQSAAAARTILLEEKNSGCSLYDEAVEGADDEKLQSCACLIVFLDHAFLSDRRLRDILTDAWKAERDLAVCELEDIEDRDLPVNLVELHKMQWLNFVHGITADMIKKLSRHLQKRGCRNTAVLPGFEYEKTEEGIVITRYSGKEAYPMIESHYGGVPVTAIGKEAFKSCIHLKKIRLPDTVTSIGDSAFYGCSGMISVSLPDSLVLIGDHAFEGCTSLTSIVIPEKVEEIPFMAFEKCAGLTSVTLPEGVKTIRPCAFSHCSSLTFVDIPKGLTFLGWISFEGCSALTSVVIPDGVKQIGHNTFTDCTNLSSVVIGKGVRKIGERAFRCCENLTSLRISGRIKEIERDAFDGCRKLTVTCPHFSAAWRYCKKENIPVEADGWFFSRF